MDNITGMEDRNPIMGAYAMLEDYPDDPDVCVAAFQLLTTFGVYDLPRIIAAFEQHVEGAERLSESQRNLATLTLKTIGASGSSSIREHAEIIRDLLLEPDDCLVHEALRLLYGYEGPEFMADTLNLVYDEICNMLDQSVLDTENFLLVTAVGVLNQFTQKKFLYNWLLKLYKQEKDQVSRAAVTIILGMIAWEPTLSSQIEAQLSRILVSSSALLKLAAAFALCLRRNLKGLPVVMTELLQGEGILDPASLREVIGHFSEEEILAQVISYLKYPRVDVSALLELERGCSYCFSSENESVHALILENIASSNPKVRQYMVMRALYCLDNQNIKTFVLCTAEYDSDSSVRAAAIEVLGACEWSPSEKEKSCHLLKQIIGSENEVLKVRIAAAQALAFLVEENARLKKLQGLMCS